MSFPNRVQPNSNIIIEAIVTNVMEALLAQKYGADRLELIHDFAAGGLSPALDLAREVCAAVSIPVQVMLRPPGANNFTYDLAQQALIAQEIEFIMHHTAARGIVFGALTVTGELDTRLLEQVLAILESSCLELTFHRAIDVSADPLALFLQLQQYGSKIKRVLTSGAGATAIEGIEMLQLMQQHCRTLGATILPASGINPNNVQRLLEATGFKELHLGSGLRIDGKLAQQQFKRLRNNCSAI
jgi:copper homeostasis protein